MKYFVGTVEVNLGGGYCVQTFLFKSDTRPGKRLWGIAQTWFSNPIEISEVKRIVYYHEWTTAVRPDSWKEINEETYNVLKSIIQEVI